MQYHSVTVAALLGDYKSTHANFFSDDGVGIGVTRLRALVHHVNTTFAEYMRKKGRKYQLTENSKKLTQSSGTAEANGEDRSESVGLSESPVEIDQNFVTKAELQAWVKKVI
jgi:arsenate reductase-like glutaredoxin family protein